MLHTFSNMSKIVDNSSDKENGPLHHSWKKKKKTQTTTIYDVCRDDVFKHFPPPEFRKSIFGKSFREQHTI